MRKFLEMAMLVVMTSFYMFPVNFTFLPALNTKMIMAVLGLGLLAIHVVSQRTVTPWKDAIVLITLAGCISIIGLFSITYNNTSDTSYVSYVVSMCVWFSAGYFLCRAISQIHKEINVELICNYFIAVCVIQCISAIGIEFVPALKDFVDTFVIQGQDSLEKGGRMYGIGASLDTAGTRFSLCLIMIVYLLCKYGNKYSSGRIFLYVISFCIVTVVGNMVARTTLIGLILGLGLFLWQKRTTLLTYNLKILSIVIVLICVATIWVTYLYNVNENVYRLVRFGFEPFFNYFSGGEFATTSNQMLKNMYVFPESLKTWIIGDGYFNNPNTHDPYYVGESSTFGYYMGTDVGYLRLIFYFGLIGLVTFILFLFNATSMACKSLPGDRSLFILTFILGLIIWLKVATDLFFVLALYVCVANMASTTNTFVPVE